MNYVSKFFPCDIEQITKRASELDISNKPHTLADEANTNTEVAITDDENNQSRMTVEPKKLIDANTDPRDSMSRDRVRACILQDISNGSFSTMDTTVRFLDSSYVVQSTRAYNSKA